MKISTNLHHIFSSLQIFTNASPYYATTTATGKQTNSTPEQNDKRSHPAADRNSLPIAEALRSQVGSMQLLEIASGYGQHVDFLAPLFPNITFQPTEIDLTSFASIRAYAADCPNQNIRDPLFVDIRRDVSQWDQSPYLQPGSYDYMFNCNMLHITPWSCALGLFRAAAWLLKPNGLLFTYGPFALNGILKPKSNVDFDLALRKTNPELGVRDIADLERVATNHRIELRQMVDMPGNNKFLTWSKELPKNRGAGVVKTVGKPKHMARKQCQLSKFNEEDRLDEWPLNKI